MNILNATYPSDIFDYFDLDSSYKKLAKQYHPDTVGSNESFIKLQELYTLAKEEMKKDFIISSTMIKLKDQAFSFYSKHTFDCGFIYVGTKQVVYHFTLDYIKIGKSFFSSFKFKDSDMEKVFKPQVLYQHTTYETKEDYFIVISKDEKEFLLADVMVKDIPVETSVWIFNRLYSFGCYLNYLGVANLDISKYTVFLNLENHVISVYGGWWHSATLTAKMKTMTLKTFNLLSVKAKTDKIATIDIVADQIKSLMLEILKGKKIDSKYSNWLTLPSKLSIIEEYQEWDSVVLPKIFPVRKFYKWTI